MSALPRVASCGLPIGNSFVAIHRGETGVTHSSGVETCSSIWSCPSCSAKIRAGRAEEISRALARHVERGGGALLVTLTLPHDAGDALRTTIRLVSNGFRSILSGRASVEDRDAYGILGQIRAFEITHGENGWHPHLHVVVVLDAPTTKDAAASLEARWQSRWDRWLVGQGWRPSVERIGVRVDQVVRDAAAVGAYVAKVQEEGKRARGAGNELARGDLKDGKWGGRTPFVILADFGSDGAAADLELWQEFQLATKGRSCIRWSRGLRAQLLPDEEELTDEDLAGAEVGGDVIAVLPAAVYRAVAARPYGEAFLFAAAERGGMEGIKRYLRSIRIDPRGVMGPDSLKSVDVREVA